MTIELPNQNLSAYTLLRPYFGVASSANLYRSLQLVSLLSFGVASAFIVKPWAFSKIYAPFDYLRESEEIEVNEAYNKFTDGILAIAAYIGVEVLPSLIKNSLISSLEKDMSRTMLGRWLSPEIAPFHGVKTRNPDVANLAAKTLTSYISSFIQSSMGLVATNSAQILSVAAAVYNITLQTRDIYDQSMPFPLNMSGGLTAAIFACSGLYIGFNFYIKKYVNKNYDAALSLSKKAEFDLGFIVHNSAQTAAFRDSGTRAKSISDEVDRASNLYKRFNIFSFFTELSSYIYGFGNEYVIAFLSLPLITKLNGKFSYSENFLPVVRMSEEGMSSLMQLVYSVFSNLQYRTSIREISRLTRELTLHEERMSKTDISISYSEKVVLQLKDLTLQAGFAGSSLFENLSYEFKSGIYRLTGENGTGKSSLLNAISGFHEGGKGAITRTKNIFYLPQNIIFESNISLQDLLIKQSRSNVVNKNEISQITARASDYLKNFPSLYGHLVKLTNPEDPNPQDINYSHVGAWGGSVLSGGQKQIIAMISLMISNNRPQLILLDEAMSAVDKESKLKLEESLKDWFSRFAEKSSIIICIDHHSRPKNKSEQFYDYELLASKAENSTQITLTRTDGAVHNLVLTQETIAKSM